MTARIRVATPADVPDMVDLLIDDAQQRQRLDATLWSVGGDAGAAVAEALRFALGADEQPFRQKWLLAEAGTELVGIAHTMLLPVPPIYAGKWGEPGLMLEDCAVGSAAPTGTADALLEAAEADLTAAGARLLLASSVPDGQWQACYERHGYERLTLYLSKDLAGSSERPVEIRPATEGDIPGIVTRSAEHRKALAALDEFWTPHAEADTRFGNWMRRSLSLADRDMLLAGPAAPPDGYAIAQPPRACTSRLRTTSPPPASSTTTFTPISPPPQRCETAVRERWRCCVPPRPRSSGEASSAPLSSARPRGPRRSPSWKVRDTGRHWSG